MCQAIGGRTLDLAFRFGRRGIEGMQNNTPYFSWKINKGSPLMSAIARFKHHFYILGITNKFLLCLMQHPSYLFFSFKQTHICCHGFFSFNSYEHCECVFIIVPIQLVLTTQTTLGSVPVQCCF